MDRTEFLDRISTRLGRERIQTAPDQPVRGVPEFYRAEPYGTLTELTPVQRFQRELVAIGGHVIHASDPTDASRALRELLAELAPNAIVTWARGEFTDWPVEWLWDEIGATLLAETSADELAAQELRRAALSADVGITLADFAIANTGTLALSTSPARPRSVSLTPTVHIALVRERQIVARMGEVLDVYAGREFGAMPSSLHFISGPSRSADIENDLSIGVHGPAALYVILSGE